ncbi:hypothetical protein ACFP1Z_21430 [Streptomyces gamaensis]|uniref:PE domain-containing protein n=1 Tax=Streptomyces gamaensis TaxID=1763542 RepID=A0ABW0Z1L5_9ACTN
MVAVAGTGEAGGSGLAAELSSLQEFKGRVDELLVKLGDSEAAPPRLSGDRLPADSLGRNFEAVQALYGAYHTVHEDLATLSQLLSDQIEALGVAVRGAGSGYADVDVEQRDRMWAVQERLRGFYGSGGGGAGSGSGGGGAGEPAPGAKKVEL